ncbi:MAG: 23S rRNA (pseudouridine(1915)-N(3))-methyltransferase RlmH [marine benthic group bacterium]|jgi:23S rRNA (pseudouridine1915-N3)-methyltransferase|nr:23S rRNA (pseudouridine(1915)-N(3))-methyltransferase RlmH [Candidatus Benthicola marisminoris]
MRVAVVAVGRPKGEHISALIREYETRACRYFRFSAIEVPASAGSGADERSVRAREAEAIRKRIPADLELWALTRGGRQLDSRKLAETLGDFATYSRAGVAFLIGGAFGLDDDLIRDCSSRFSLSSLTLPHELARLVLAEQIYRAGTILRGEPYHKGA